jgi:hypothetical protein
MTKKAAKLRVSYYLKEQAQHLEAADNKKAALIRKQIVKAEEIKKMYMQLCQYLNPQGRSSLNHLHNLHSYDAEYMTQSYLRH